MTKILISTNQSAVKGDKYSWLKPHVDKVVREFTKAFQADPRFQEWPSVVDRFVKAASVAQQKKFAKLDAVEEAHNELCVASALLESVAPRFDLVEYEPQLDGCARSIDFRATDEKGRVVYVDVKTIQPQFKDRWGQFEKANAENWFPDNTKIILSQDALGGCLWHAMFSARSSMLDYTCELERKIASANIEIMKNTFVVLALCGNGFHWCEVELEDFVSFYRPGVHRADDALSKMEAVHIARNKIHLAKTVSQFAYMERSQRGLKYDQLIWNVQPPIGWE